MKNEPKRAIKQAANADAKDESRIRAFIKRTRRAVLPDGLVCAVCSQELFDFDKFGICRECADLLVRKGCTCSVCGKGINEGGKLCSDCFSKKNSFTRVIGVSSYSGIAVHLVYRLKFARQRYYGVIMARMMTQAYIDSGLSADYITFVPSHPLVVRERGYSQAQVIAKEVADELGLKCVEYLYKVKDTTPQERVGYFERANNVKDSFEARGVIKGGTVLLIDDVLTSGSTLNECAAQLLKRGAKKVFALVFSTSNRFDDYK